MRLCTVEKEIVDSHKGYIEVESEVERGTTFTVGAASRNVRSLRIV